MYGRYLDGMSTPSLAHQIKEKKIGECLYRVEPLGALDARKAFVRLANLLGPGLQALKLSQEQAAAAETDEAGALSAMSSGLGGLLANLKDEDLDYFERIFRFRTTVVMPDGREPKLSDLPQHFAPGNPDAGFKAYLPWLVFCLDCNFGEVFQGAWRANVARISARVKGSHSTSAAQSTGTSTDS